jgi:hypothetical protein
MDRLDPRYPKFWNFISTSKWGNRENIPLHKGSKIGRSTLTTSFVLAADLLQTVINNAKDQGLMNLPILTSASSNFLVVQYADDTLLIMETCPRQLTGPTKYISPVNLLKSQL